MAMFKCKMCGGSLEVSEGMTVCECEYCGTSQTLPKSGNEVTANLFNRANNLRMKCEFDKAQEIYEKIISADPSDSEAYWGLVLCKYGIEYVEDPATFRKIPTCHRTQLESVFADVDYNSAIENADSAQKSLYEAEAKEIDRLQKEILAIVHNEKPFDVFICYKESDENGKRTPDSVIANDIYHQLTQEGFKVFYAAITLEDKLGQAYEPYIFAALNSSKVMLSIGTKPEYFNAVWVKNEWSRYIKLMKNDRSRLLIPCYKDMDAYDLPEEFSHLQAQDMGKIGFINDVVRGINKVLKKDEPQPTVQVVQQTTQVSANVENLLKRGNLALEDKKWAEADGFFEQVLNENVEEPRAYLGKLLAEYKVSNEKQLENCNADFSNSNNYKKAVRFGYKKLEEIYKQSAYNQAVDLMNKAKNDLIFIQAKEMFVSLKDFKDSGNKAQECEEKALEYLYNQALNSMKNAGNEVQYRKVKSQFLSIKNYKDSERKAEECEEKALECEEKKLNDLYEKALHELKNAHTETGFLSAKEKFKKLGDYRDSKNRNRECDELIQAEKTELLYIKARNLQSTNNIKQIEEAITIYKQIINYKDSKQQIENCNRKIEEITQKAEQEEQERERLNKLAEKERKRRAKRNKMIAIIASSSAAIGIAAVVLVTNVVIPNMNYNDAMDLYNSGKYEEAITAFEAMGGYKNSADMILKAYTEIDEINYQNALSLYNSSKYEEAIIAFMDLITYKDSEDMMLKACAEIDEMNYQNALSLYNDCKYEEAISVFEELEDYKNSEEILEKCNLYISGIGDVVTFGGYNWYVIEKKETGCKLLCEKIATYRYYNIDEDITWENCTLRSWLNNEFYNEFSEEEKAMIVKTKLSNLNNPEYGTDGGNDTEDYIYLLSIDETEEISRELLGIGELWMLRSPGNSKNYVATVDAYGGIFTDGDRVCLSKGVRPVINIKFE